MESNTKSIDEDENMSKITAFLKSINAGHPIKIRVRKEKDMVSESLYLEYNSDCGTEKLSLRLYVQKNEKSPAKSDPVQMAIAIRDRKEKELYHLGYDFRLASAVSFDQLNVYDAMKGWFEKHYTEPQTCKNAIVALNQFKECFGKYPKKIDQFRRQDLLEFRSFLLKRKHQNHARGLFRKVAKFFSEMVLLNIIAVSPAMKIGIPKLETKIVALDFQEVKKIAETSFTQMVDWVLNEGQSSFLDKRACHWLSHHCSEEKFEMIRDAFIFACYTGLRPSDLKNLRVSDFSEGAALVRMKKTKEIIQVVLSENARQISEKWAGRTQGEDFFIFPLPRSTDISRVLKTIARMVNISKKMEFRISRRTFASLCVQNGVDIYQTSKLMGHSNVKTTEEYYAQLDTQTIRGALDRLPLL